VGIEENTMDAEFVSWCRDISVGESAEQLAARWQGVRGLADSLKASDIDILMRVIYRARAGAAAPVDDIARIRESVRRAFPLFQMTGNDREFEVVCAAAIARVIRTNESLAAIATLSVCTASLAETRKLNFAVDLVALSEAALVRLATKMRVRRSITLPDQPQLVDYDGALKKFQAQPDVNGVVAGWTVISQSIPAAKRSQLEERVALAAALDRLEVVDEELQMLWWLFGERTGTLDSAFADIPQNARPLTFAYELAQLTIRAPGPASVKGLLQRAGIKGQKNLEIVAAVNACSTSWLPLVIRSGAISATSTPILFAISKKVETDDNAAWVSGWAAVAGIPANTSLPPLIMATQFYRELLLAKARM
jgi:hypothetical protein